MGSEALRSFHKFIVSFLAISSGTPSPLLGCSSLRCSSVSRRSFSSSHCSFSSLSCSFTSARSVNSIIAYTIAIVDIGHIMNQASDILVSLLFFKSAT
eukprot:UN33497